MGNKFPMVLADPIHRQAYDLENPHCFGRNQSERRLAATSANLRAVIFATSSSV